MSAVNHNAAAAGLTLADLKSPTWMHIKALLQRRLEEHREANDHEQAAEKTAALRGRIKELKFLLALQDPAPEVGGEQS